MVDQYRIPEKLKTACFELRRPHIADAEAIFSAYATDLEVTRYLGWKPHRDVAVTRLFLKTLDEEWNRSTGFPFMICAREEPHQIIGNIHVHVNHRGVSFGYVLRRESWGQGCATEVLTHLIEHALAQPTTLRTYAFCDVENRASARVMEKAGMQKEGLLRRYFLHPNISDEPRDCLLYSRVH